MILFLASQNEFKNKITNEEIKQTIDIFKNISLQNNIQTLSDDFLHSMIALAEKTHNEKFENILSRNWGVNTRSNSHLYISDVANKVYNASSDYWGNIYKTRSKYCK